MPFVKMVTKEGEFTPVQLGDPTMIVEILEMQTYRFIRINDISQMVKSRFSLSRGLEQATGKLQRKY
jgi:hypothetical protein